MKAKLIFDLNDPDDCRSHELAVKSFAMNSLLWEFDQWLRSEIKYKELPDGWDEAYQSARDKLREMAGESDLINLIFE